MKLFSVSNKRWDILLKYVKISVTSWAETRWESRIRSIEAVRYQARQIIEAHLEVREPTADPVVRVEAQYMDTLVDVVLELLKKARDALKGNV